MEEVLNGNILPFLRVGRLFRYFYKSSARILDQLLDLLV